MKECEATGKTIEQAVQNALLELKASREDVDIKILNEGGFLKKARVLVTISPDALEKYEKKEKFKKTLLQEENDEDFAENFLKRKAEQSNSKEKNAAEKEEKIEQQDNTNEKTESTENKPTKTKVRIVTDEEISSNEKDEAQEEITEKEQRKLISAEEFLKGVLDSLGLEGQIEKTEDERFVRYNLVGENLNDLIGHHGECMLSLSQIMNSTCESNHKKIVLDIEGYRARREESLISLAKRTADKVAKSGRYFKFEPMDASERKIIHTALQDDDRVTTLSKGEEPHRYLIVFPKEYSDR